MAKRKRGKVVGTVVVGPSSGSGGGHPKPQTVKPPAGYYDPALDAALGAAQRGLGYQQADYTRDYGAGGAGGRGLNDYQIGLGQLLQQHSNTLADIATAQTRAKEDRATALANLGLQYGRLARGQAQNDRRAGVMSAGVRAQQQQVRAANQLRDTQPIEMAFQRRNEDLYTQRQREGQGFQYAQGQLGLGYQRAATDATTALQRAGAETNQFGIDTQASRLYQATQAGYVPPGAGGGSSKRRRRAARVGRPRFGQGALGVYTGPNTAAGVGAV